MTDTPKPQTNKNNPHFFAYLSSTQIQYLFLTRSPRWCAELTLYSPHPFAY